MDNKNNNKGVIILLVIIIIILGVLCVLFATDTINLDKKINGKNQLNSTNEIKDNTENSKIYTYAEIKGVYNYETESKKDSSGNEYKLSFSLSLYENGTFSYRMASMAPFGYIGNYIIKDDTLLLNYLFRTTSGVGSFRTTGTKTITINSDSTLVDTNPMEKSKYDNLDIPNTVTLKKDTSAKLEDDFSHYINEPISDSPSED